MLSLHALQVASGIARQEVALKDALRERKKTADLSGSGEGDNRRLKEPSEVFGFKDQGVVNDSFGLPLTEKA